MSVANYELVARVGKARGLEGEVTASAAVDLPFCLYEGLACHVVPPTLYGPREVTISSISEGKGSALILGFEEVSNIDEAEQLAGRSLLANVDDLDFSDDDRWFIGCNVVDERYGDLGEVTELIETPANDVIVVVGPYGEVLIPVLDDVFVESDEEDDEVIRTRIMDGIIDQEPPASA